MNRGIARRTVFENRADVRAFLARLAIEVRRGTIEVHAFAVMTTHVHLLIRSPLGQLASAMKRIFNAYVKYFNRLRRRDGSLFRGRFRSRPVTSVIDRLNVIAYSDDNPVQARLVLRSEDYPYGSARFWASGRAPPWFSTSFVIDVLRQGQFGARAVAESYRREFRSRAGPSLSRLLEARMHRGVPEADELDDLVAAAPARVYAWMVRKARLADQTAPGLPLVDPGCITGTLLADHLPSNGTQGGRGPSPREIARVALLRDLGGLRYAKISAVCRTSATEARLRYVRHAALVAADAAYADAFGALVSNLLAASHRPPPRPA